jgi:2-methylisocitrate lyase-like PEP mutase family enzyme
VRKAGDNFVEDIDRAMRTQAEKGQAFRALHQRKSAFIIPNPWDIGSARMLAHLGFEALATTSGGYAFSMGQRDYTVGREMVLAHISALAPATDLPISADLENGFGDAPEAAAETIRLAAAAGAVGGSIEDATGRADQPIYEPGPAAERVRAAAEMARGLGFPFTLTARAENYLHGRRDLKGTIGRLQAYQEAGADVLYAPGLTNKDDIAALVSSVDRPVNVLVGIPGAPLKLTDLSAIGVRRVSLGSGLARAAFGSLLNAGREMRENGTFAFAEEAPSSRDIGAMF